MQIEVGATEHGFPSVTWADVRLSFRFGLEHARQIDKEVVPRRLWVGADGVHLWTWLERPRFEGLVRERVETAIGRWDELEHLVVTTTRDDLDGSELQSLAGSRLEWLEHQILELHFAGGEVVRVSLSGASLADLRRLHDVLTQVFMLRRPKGPLVARANERGLDDRVIGEKDFTKKFEKWGSTFAVLALLWPGTAVAVSHGYFGPGVYFGSLVLTYLWFACSAEIWGGCFVVAVLLLFAK